MFFWQSIGILFTISLLAGYFFKEDETKTWFDGAFGVIITVIVSIAITIYPDYHLAKECDTITPPQGTIEENVTDFIRPPPDQISIGLSYNHPSVILFFIAIFFFFLLGFSVYNLIKSFYIKRGKILNKESISNIKISFTKNDDVIVKIELDPKNENSIRRFIKKVVEADNDK